MESWGAAIAGICGVAALILKAYQAGKPKRDEERRADEKNDFRTAVAAGDTDRVQSDILRLLDKDGSDTGRADTNH